MALARTNSNVHTTDTSSRIISLDQFRGYTVAGMLLVNYLGPYKFTSAPRLLTHTHDYCSYADTIMPQFLFAVGFSFRLTFGRRARRSCCSRSCSAGFCCSWHRCLMR